MNPTTASLVVVSLVYGVAGFIAVRNAIKTKNRNTVTLALAVVFVPVAISAAVYAVQ